MTVPGPGVEDNGDRHVEGYVVMVAEKINLSEFVHGQREVR